MEKENEKKAFYVRRDSSAIHPKKESVYEEINIRAFSQNFNVLIDHYKKTLGSLSSEGDKPTST